MGFYGVTVMEDAAIFGLGLIGTVDTGSGYRYNESAVWFQFEGRRFLYGNTQGCSCSSPWEGYTEIAHLIPVDSLVWLHRQLDRDHEHGEYRAATEVAKLLELCAEAGLR